MSRIKQYFTHTSKPGKDLLGLFLVNDLSISLKLVNVTLQEIAGLPMQLQVKKFL